MTVPTMEVTSRALVAGGKGILAADETPATLGKRLAVLGIESTPENRRAYREILFTTPGIVSFIGGIILQDETIRQQSAGGEALIALVANRGIIPGIKVDESTHPLAGAPGEKITEGLDRLRDRLEEYRRLGARFAKWRAVIRIDDGLPSEKCVQSNAHALARYAALCQEQGLVPIVEPEVLIDGDHTLERCEEVSGRVLHAVFDALALHDVALEQMLLKPSMVIAGRDCPQQASVDEVANATVRTLRRQVPSAVPGVVFLSGGQDHLLATAHLNAINQLEGAQPWVLSFSYGRALQDEAMELWAGQSENVAAAQGAFYHRAKCCSAAVLGSYSETMESEAASDDTMRGDTTWHTH